MKLPTSMPRLKGFRFPREIVAYAVWAYHRFALSTADVEDLLAERGVIGRAMPQGDILGFAPPFCLTEDEADLVVARTKDAVASVLG